MSTKTEITKDLANKKINVTREFAAPLEKVWKAWTDVSLLEQWWAPKPWKAVSKSYDFSEGGFWLYSMVGPNGETAWCRVNFKTIVPQQSFTSTALFCDENGVVNPDFPPMHWLVTFHPVGASTRVVAELTFDSEADLEKIVAMGFEEGFTMALGNLDEILEA
ncbi:SRPBCC domain-containing protein [Mucilaginibacter sp. RCC_168]|uniref:SRPBCC family protein n=1 Tax=Mucilaginibacter sp. RCC_168 TaxID=3239221 RepID=UPI0035245E36